MERNLTGLTNVTQKLFHNYTNFGISTRLDPTLTITQSAAGMMGQFADMALNDMPESKAIADTADSVWGIILTPQMKLDSVYHWKWLKLRDCSSDYARIRFQFNKQFLKLHSDEYMASDVI